MDLILKTSPTNDGDDAPAEEKRLFLRPDETKKSVFWLDLVCSSSSSATAATNSTASKNNDEADNGDKKDEAASSSESAAAEISISAPAEAWIAKRPLRAAAAGQDDPMFAWGGMQLTSNAKAIEIYYTAPKGKEAYLTTVKGIPSASATTTTGTTTTTTTRENFLYKALCAVPGGPRPVVAVRFKFLSLQPKGEATQFRLSTLKWTARIAAAAASSSSTGAPNAATSATTRSPMPPPAAAAASTAIPSMASLFGGGAQHVHHHAHGLGGAMPTWRAGTAAFGQSSMAASAAPLPPTQQEPPASITKDDIGAAMAGMSFALRSTEERLAAQIQKVGAASHQTLLAALHRQVHDLTLQMRAQQSQVLQDQATLIRQQQAMLTAQAKDWQSLKDIMTERLDGISLELARIAVQHPDHCSSSAVGKNDATSFSPAGPGEPMTPSNDKADEVEARANDGNDVTPGSSAAESVEAPTNHGSCDLTSFSSAASGEHYTSTTTTNNNNIQTKEETGTAEAAALWRHYACLDL